MEQRDFSPWSQLGYRRPRLLIENPDPALGVSDFRRFVDAGFDVALCAGPADGEPCPLAGWGECHLSDTADIVVMGRGLADREEIAAALHVHRPGLPVVAEVLRGSPETAPDGCIPMPVPTSVDGQVRAVWRVLDGPAHHPAAGPLSAPPITPPCSQAESATEARLLDLLGW